MKAGDRRKRKNILIRRYGYICHICQGKIDPSLRSGDMSLTLDHKIPRSKGGANALDNLALAHYICNHEKQDE
jgi:5-methylcytosine-specific restriction endonuclease McrA